MVELELIDTPHEIIHNIYTFNGNSFDNKKRATHTVRTTSYWVKDENSGMFGPSNFIAYKSMNYKNYETATKLYYTGAKFNGNNARIHIERILNQKYLKDLILINDLLSWGQKLLGANIFNGIKRSKWKFITLNH